MDNAVRPRSAFELTRLSARVLLHRPRPIAMAAAGATVPPLLVLALGEQLANLPLIALGLVGLIALLPAGQLAATRAVAEVWLGRRSDPARAWTDAVGAWPGYVSSLAWGTAALALLALLPGCVSTGLGSLWDRPLALGGVVVAGAAAFGLGLCALTSWMWVTGINALEGVRGRAALVRSARLAAGTRWSGLLLLALAGLPALGCHAGAALGGTFLPPLRIPLLAVAQTLALSWLVALLTVGYLDRCCRSGGFDANVLADWLDAGAADATIESART